MTEPARLENTSWTLIEAAAAGKGEARDRFARLYTPFIQAVVRRILANRHGRSLWCFQEVENASQNVFQECFKPRGVLTHCDRKRGSFRAYLYAVVRNVTRRTLGRLLERQPECLVQEAVLDTPTESVASLSRQANRQWAMSLLTEATQRQADRARQQGEAERKHVELLQLVFSDGLSIQQIATRWGTSRRAVYAALTLAKQEFMEALQEVLADHYPNSSTAAKQALDDLLESVGCRVPNG